MIAAVQAPSIDYSALAHLFALGGGAVLVLMIGLLRAPFAQQKLAPGLAILTLLAAGDLAIRQWGEGNDWALSGALRIDDLALTMILLFLGSALAAIAMAWRTSTVKEVGRGEFYGLVLSATAGMAVLASAQNLVAFFAGFELFSISLYVLCATSLSDRRSLEAGLKYLIVGSFGSATMLYGMALIYGATGSTDFSSIQQAVSERGLAGDTLMLTGVALVLVGLAFKASIAPFHQWTPDVYEGAPTPVTAFMAVATKAAAFAILLRFVGQAIPTLQDDWGPMLAVIAALTIAVGNLGAIAQTSLKRMLAYSGVAQAGYLAAGVVVGTELGARAVVFYLIAYLFMNMAAFAVVQARQHAGLSDEIASVRGLGREAPVLAWSMTIAMVALSGLPITVGFFGKFFLIEAAVDGNYAWLGVAIVIGSAISLVYYLRVVATMWMPSSDLAGQSRSVAPPSAPAAPVPAGADPAAEAPWEIVTLAALSAAATVVFGFYPEPLLDIARDAGEAFSALL